MQKTRKLPEREGALPLACRRALVMWGLLLATKSSSVLGLGSQQLMNNLSPGSKAKQHQVQRVQTLLLPSSTPGWQLAGSALTSHFAQIPTGTSKDDTKGDVISQGTNALTSLPADCEHIYNNFTAFWRLGQTWILLSAPRE